MEIESIIITNEGTNGNTLNVLMFLRREKSRYQEKSNEIVNELNEIVDEKHEIETSLVDGQ